MLCSSTTRGTPGRARASAAAYECSATTADPVWRSTRSTLLVDGHYLGDLTVNGSAPDWRTTSGTSSCDPATHSYQLLYTPTQTGPLTLGLADLDLSDNLGTLTVTIGPAG